MHSHARRCVTTHELTVDSPLELRMTWAMTSNVGKTQISRAMRTIMPSAIHKSVVMRRNDRSNGRQPTSQVEPNKGTGCPHNLPTGYRS
jgi:hypothetical protein